jgi:hypothetical protein
MSHGLDEGCLDEDQDSIDHDSIEHDHVHDNFGAIIHAIHRQVNFSPCILAVSIRTSEWKRRFGALKPTEIESNVF